MPHSIYIINLYLKGQEHQPPALVWEGNAPNLVDAFAQTRHAYNSMIHNSATTTLLVEKRDYDAESIHSYPILFRRLLDNPRFDRQD